MRLINCHIENFGRLSGYDRDFTEGCNNIMASNGQGKSTLAAFIRVMFYGFEGEGKRKAGENERKRYEPWQGGVYGGRLRFSDGEKTYEISRTFGSKSSEDTFELRDALTNLVSNDYSDNIGEELFKVNAESYMRTAYIGQNDVITHTTDGINAMIGGIADNEGDLESFEKAAGRLADLLNKESPTRATGSLYRLEGEVTSLRTRVREGSVIVDSIHRLEDSMAVRQQESDRLKEDREALLVKQKQIGTYKDKQALKDRWEMLLSEATERTDEAKVRRVAFPKDVPDEGELTGNQETASEYARICENVSFYTLNSEEENKLSRYADTFADGLPDMNETTVLIRKWREHDKSLADETDKKAELKVLKSELDGVRREAGSLPTKAIIGMVMILAAMIGAVAAILLMPSNVLRYAGVGMAGVLLIGGVLLTIFGIRSHKEALEAKVLDIEKDIRDIEGYISEGERFRREVTESIRRYLDRYGIPIDPSAVTDDLRHLHTMADEYTRLKDKKAEYEKCISRRDALKLTLDKYLAKLGINPESDYVRQLNRLSMDLRSYIEASDRETAAVKRVEEFKAEHDVGELEDIKLMEDMPSLEELNNEIAALTARIDETAGHIRDESRQHDALQEKYEIWEEDQVSLGLKEQQLLDGKHRYKNLKSASKYLTMAKESITAKYMEPLLTGFSKYYSSVTGTSADMYHIDANTNITVDELGGQRDTALLSTGYQDLIGFCLRLALIDAMYEEEKPVLVLDDPFVNLDSERLKGAQRLMDKLSESYQMIYFTCRNA